MLASSSGSFWGSDEDADDAEDASEEDDTDELGWYLGCSLPLTTGLRTSLLGCTSALKRMRDIVDALRLLQEPERAGDRRLRKFNLLWMTAEASGCEVEPPRAVP